MPFVKPSSNDEAAETSGVPRRDRVNVEWSETPVSLRDAVEAQDGVLTTYVERVAMKDDLHRLDRKLDLLREQVDKLERIIDVLAAVSPLSISGECPQCDGELELSSGTVDDTVACEACGHVVAYVQSPV